MQAERTTIQIFQNSDETVAYAAGSVLFSAGEAAHSMYVIKSGRVRVESDGKHIEDLRAGDILGEMSLVTGEARSATATALVDSELVEINEDRFKFLIEQTPYFALDVMRIMAKRLRAMNARV